MEKKDKKVNAWQIIVAVFQALAALFGSLKKSHDSAKPSLTQKGLRKIPKVTNKFCCGQIRQSHRESGGIVSSDSAAATRSVQYSSVFTKSSQSSQSSHILE